MAELTRQGREKIQGFIHDNIAVDIQRYWRGNLTDSQQTLAQDIQIYEETGAVLVGSTNPVLKYLEWGTKPHIITPDEADALRWFNDQGEPVFAMRVQHPGFEPYAHMRTAIDRKRTELGGGNQ